MILIYWHVKLSISQPKQYQPTVRPGCEEHITTLFHTNTVTLCNASINHKSDEVVDTLENVNYSIITLFHKITRHRITPVMH